MAPLPPGFFFVLFIVVACNGVVAHHAVGLHLRQVGCFHFFCNVGQHVLQKQTGIFLRGRQLDHFRPCANQSSGSCGHGRTGRSRVVHRGCLLWHVLPNNPCNPQPFKTTATPTPTPTTVVHCRVNETFGGVLCQAFTDPNKFGFNIDFVHRVVQTSFRPAARHRVVYGGTRRGPS